MPDVTYVVQLRSVATIDSVSGVVVWQDVAEITVPPRTKMRTVRQRAAEVVFEGGAPIGAEPGLLRVLEKGAAAVFRVAAVVRDPQLVIEEVVDGEPAEIGG